MTLLLRILSRAWIVVTVVACALVARSTMIRTERIERVSEIGAETRMIDPVSTTGYAGGVRKLIVPERHAASYQWIMQTQQMLARGEWRVRRADYDNAPLGREVHIASPYRWWLGLLAMGTAAVSGTPVGIGVERAALFAGPLWHGLLIVVTAIYAARRFGGLTAAVLAAGLVGLFPLGGAFAPGQPDDFAFSCGFALWSVLLLLPSAREMGGAPGAALADAGHRRRARHVFLAGLAGGVGLWINVRIQVPVLIGVMGGAIAAAWLNRRCDAPALPMRDVAWRAWALGGAAMSVLAYLLEYFPTPLDVTALRLEVNHPLYALAWLGTGELLARISDWARGGRFLQGDRRSKFLVLAAGAAVASLPASILLHATRGFTAAEPADLKLTQLSESAAADALWDWIMRDGLGAQTLITLLPLVAFVPAVWILLRRRRAQPATVSNVCLTLGPALVLLFVSSFRLRGWNVLDALLLGLVAACLVRPASLPERRRSSWAWSAAVLAGLIPGLWLLQPRARERAPEAVTESEAQSLVERDLAYWLANRADAKPVVFLAPPASASSLMFYGGLRALATPYWENFDGFSGAVRIAGATSLAQAESLTRRRELDYIILPSWDLDLDAYARLGAEDPETSLVSRLNRWLPPLWLRPIAYKIPVIEGFTGRSIAIFAVTEMQEDALALARLAEYFAEMSRLDFALRVAETLAQRYPADVGGMVARAQVAASMGDASSFGEVLASLLPALTREEDADLAWDRRVSLAIVLAQGKRAELARAQLLRCLEQMDEEQLRSLSTSSLIRTLSLLRRFELELPEGELREVARKLLPPEMRDQIP